MTPQQKRIRSYLIEKARSRRPTVSYQDLSDACNLKLDMIKNPYDRIVIGYMLGDVSEYEHNKKRPLLSALVVHKNTTDEEGGGFYIMLRQLKLNNGMSVQQMKNAAVGGVHQTECINFWNDINKYYKYKDDA